MREAIKYKKRLWGLTPNETRHNQAKRARFRTRGHTQSSKIVLIGVVSADVLLFGGGNEVR